MLTAELEVLILRFKELQANTFISVVSEHGVMELNQLNQQEKHLELDSTDNLPNNQPTGEMEE
jgi:hypothetical protein